MVSAIGRSLRWLLVPVSGAAVVVLCAFAARWSVLIVDGRCPAHSMVGGSCVERWHTTAVEISIFAAVALAALGLVLLPAAVAPGLKRAVAAVGFAIAAGVGGAAYFVTGWADMLVPFMIATTAGAAGLWRVWSRRHST